MLLPHQPSDNGRFVQSKIGGSAPLIEMRHDLLGDDLELLEHQVLRRGQRRPKLMCSMPGYFSSSPSEADEVVRRAGEPRRRAS